MPTGHNVQFPDAARCSVGPMQLPNATAGPIMRISQTDEPHASVAKVAGVLNAPHGKPRGIVTRKEWPFFYGTITHKKVTHGRALRVRSRGMKLSEGLRECSTEPDRSLTRCPGAPDLDARVNSRGTFRACTPLDPSFSGRRNGSEGRPSRNPFLGLSFRKKIKGDRLPAGKRPPFIHLSLLTDPGCRD